MKRHQSKSAKQAFKDMREDFDMYSLSMRETMWLPEALQFGEQGKKDRLYIIEKDYYVCHELSEEDVLDIEIFYINLNLNV